MTRLEASLRGLVALTITTGVAIAVLAFLPGRAYGGSIAGSDPWPVTQDHVGEEQDVPPGAGRIIGSPEAGPDPQQSGDRGGWAQLLTLALVAGGVGFVIWRIVRAARRTSRSSGVA